MTRKTIKMSTASAFGGIDQRHTPMHEHVEIDPVTGLVDLDALKKQRAEEDAKQEAAARDARILETQRQQMLIASNPGARMTMDIIKTMAGPQSFVVVADTMPEMVPPKNSGPKNRAARRKAMHNGK